MKRCNIQKSNFFQKSTLYGALAMLSLLLVLSSCKPAQVVPTDSAQDVTEGDAIGGVDDLDDLDTLAAEIDENLDFEELENMREME